VTTLEVELHLMKHFDFRQNLIIPNVTYASRLVKFETDLLILSKSNYAHGIEIKVSLSDFKKDFKKDHIDVLTHKNKTYRKNGFKTFYKPLRYFSYAFPEKLLDFAKDNVDERFGLFSIRKVVRDYGERVFVDEVRKPKTLFFNKWTDEDRMKLMHLGCMRIYNLKRKELKK